MKLLMKSMKRLKEEKMEKMNKFKQNKWYNFGDANPRLHGGVFIKRTENEIETISIDISQFVSEKYDNNKSYNMYIVNRRTDYVDELVRDYQQFKKNCNSRGGVGVFADWKRYIELEKTVDMSDIVFYLAADTIAYYGGSCESESGTNFWALLKQDGITPRNYI